MCKHFRLLSINAINTKASYPHWGACPLACRSHRICRGIEWSETSRKRLGVKAGPNHVTRYGVGLTISNSSACPDTTNANSVGIERSCEFEACHYRLPGMSFPYSARVFLPSGIGFAWGVGL
jgi:hypothetical protein